MHPAMNPRTRRLALHCLAGIAVLASLNALLHSYVGLAEWALAHGMEGAFAWTFPAMVDVFLLAGELALYVAYLDGWSGSAKLWPWITALIGLGVSVAGNVGRISSGQLADQLTAATAPVAAFAGLFIALLTLKQLALRQAPAPSDRPVPSGDGRTAIEPAQPRSSSNGHSPVQRDTIDAALDQARQVDEQHQADHGRPASVKALRTQLGVGQGKAQTLRRQLTDESEVAG